MAVEGTGHLLLRLVLLVGALLVILTTERPEGILLMTVLALLVYYLYKKMGISL
jgi:hypothetical protein